jgi:hypothetical protein
VRRLVPWLLLGILGAVTGLGLGLGLAFGPTTGTPLALPASPGGSPGSSTGTGSSAPPATTTTQPSPTTTSSTTAPTTAAGSPTSIPTSPSTTTPATQVSTASCPDPAFSASNAQDSDNVDPDDGFQYWWVNNDAWNGSAGPQSIDVCNQSSWYAVSNQPNVGGAVETYPDSEYDVGGRSNPSTTPISGWQSISSTFSEAFPSGAGAWDAAYDLWLNNWSTEIMIWNEWSGAQSYWPAQATTSLTLDGVPYTFYNNGGELMFFRTTQVKAGSVDIVAAFQWLVSQGLVKSTDVPTQLEYGVEVCATSGTETFPLTGLTFALSQ